jgi:hypothetical protein
MRKAKANQNEMLTGQALDVQRVLGGHAMAFGKARCADFAD